MLDAFIIDQIKKREQRDDRPTLDLPLPSEPTPAAPDSESQDDAESPTERGVVIIDFGS